MEKWSSRSKTSNLRNEYLCFYVIYASSNVVCKYYSVSSFWLRSPHRFANILINKGIDDLLVIF